MKEEIHAKIANTLWLGKETKLKLHPSDLALIILRHCLQYSYGCLFPGCLPVDEHISAFEIVQQENHTVHRQSVINVPLTSSS